MHAENSALQSPLYFVSFLMFFTFVQHCIISASSLVLSAWCFATVSPSVPLLVLKILFCKNAGNLSLCCMLEILPFALYLLFYFLFVSHFCATLYRIFFALDFLQHFMMSFCTRLLCNNALLSVSPVCILNNILYFCWFFHSASYLFALDFCAALHYLSPLSACGCCGLPLPRRLSPLYSA